MEIEEKTIEEQVRDYQRQSEEKFQDTISKLKDKIPTIIAIAIMVFWIFYGTISVEPSEIEIKSRIALSIATVVLSACYCNLLAEDGFTHGKMSKTFNDANTRWRKLSQDGLSKRKQINRYALDMAKSNLKQIRKSGLESVGLSYNDYFDDEGKLLKPFYFKDKNLYSKQKKMIKRCSKLKVYVPNLFCSISGSLFGIKKPESEKAYRSKNYTIKTLIRAILSIVSVGIMFKFNEFSIGGIVYSLFQIVLWSISGWNQRINNYRFVTETLVEQIEDKAAIIDGYFKLSDIERNQYEDRAEGRKDFFLGNKEIAECEINNQ